MTLQLPIEEYFRYHPPTTPERIALHDRVNRESLEICQNLINNDPMAEPDRDTRIAKEDRVRGICERAINLATDVCTDSDCWGWAIYAVDECKSTALTCTTPRRNTSILMRVQQFRMFLNQGITVDELRAIKERDRIRYEPLDRYANGEIDVHELARLLDKSIEDTERILELVVLEKRQQLGEGMAKVTAVDIGTTSEYSGIHLTLDGNKWCAHFGENLQVGIAGFGDDPIEALSDLYADLKGIEFSELKNDSGKIYSTAIKAILPVGENLEKYRAFIDSYGSALYVRSNEGFSDREVLIADAVGDEQVEYLEVGDDV